MSILDYIPGIGAILKFNRIRDDYSFNKKKANGDPYNINEAENIAREQTVTDTGALGIPMRSITMKLFGGIKDNFLNKGLNFGAGKIDNKLEGAMTKKHQTWEEYYNSDKYYNSPENPYRRNNNNQSTDESTLIKGYIEKTQSQTQPLQSQKGFLNGNSNFDGSSQMVASWQNLLSPSNFKYNQLQDFVRVPNALQGGISNEPSFLESLGLEDMHKQSSNFYEFGYGLNLSTKSSFQSNESGESFLESLGYEDMHKQFGHLYEFGGSRVNVGTDNRFNAPLNNLDTGGDNTGTSNSILVNDDSGVNSSPSFIAQASQNAPTSASWALFGFSLGAGAGFFFNPYVAIIAVVGLIVGFLNSLLG